MFGRKQYAAEGYNSCDSTEPILIALLRSPPRLPCANDEYIAHGMWIMAEISGRGHLSYNGESYLLTIQSVTELSKKELVTADSIGCLLRS